MHLALVLPEGRLWDWHKRLIDELGHEHGLDVFISPGPSLPACLSLVLQAEAAMYGGRGSELIIGAERFGRSFHQVSELDPAAFNLIVDLTGTSRRYLKPCLGLRFNGRDSEDALYGSLVQRRSPLLEIVDGDDQVIAASYAALEVRTELRRSLRLVHARLLALVLRSIGRFGASALHPNGEIAQPVDLNDGSFSCAKTLAFVAGAVTAKAIEKFRTGSHWNGLWTLAIRRQLDSREPWNAEGYVSLKSGGEAFLADPCLHLKSGRTHLFAEALSFGQSKGRIVCAALNEAGEAGDFRTVLEEEHHLSYPFVFDHDGETFMVPESGASGRVDLYRAISYPGVWRREHTLISGRKLVDSTLFRHGGLWWLFASGSNNGGSSHDELFGFYSEGLVGPWAPCRRAPMRSDCRSARPAGAILDISGHLYRPSQDNEARYGGGLRWAEILKLDPDTFVEQPVAALAGSDFGPYQGVHTYSQGGGFEVIDLLRTNVRV